MSSHGTVAVTFFDDGEDNTWSVNVTTDLAALLGHAHRWALAERSKDKCTLTFSSMLAAMAAGPDPLCEWLRGHLALRGVSDQVVTRGRAFAAWPLPDDKLWTTFEHVFRNLRFGANETEQVLEQRRTLALAEMAAVQDVREKRQGELANAEAAEHQLRQDLERIDREIEHAIRGKEEELGTARAAVEKAQERLQKMVVDQARALEEAHQHAPAQETIALMARTLLEDNNLKQLEADVQRASQEARWVGLNVQNIVLGVVVLVLTTLAMFTLSFLRDTKFIVGAVGLVAALAPIGHKWLTVLRDLAQKGRAYQAAVRARTEAAVKELEQVGATSRAEHTKELAARRAEVEKLRADMEQLAAKTQVAKLALTESEERRTKATVELAAATADVADKRKQLKSITSGALLEELVRDLTATDAYKKELGTFARARTDFERLSERMLAARRDFEAGRSKAEPVLERIVLYIDDLDRCPEDRVREVLRAVHLLLAFDLFACVVAVDPRWVIQCLRASPGVTTSTGAPDSELEVLGGMATPSDYLEKIFQIPLWLRPIAAEQRAPVIGTLLCKHLHQGGADSERNAAKTNSTKEMRSESEREGRESAPRETVRAPERIKIDPGELAFLPRVAPLLDGNVRALKRFVNTYLLVKTSISDVEFEYFARGNPHRICMAQLAVLATQRSRGRALVRLVDAASADRTLGAWLAELKADKDSIVQSLGADLESSLMPELEDLQLATFALWLERTRRYSFYL